MALTKVQTAGIADDAIDSDQYANASIDNAHLADDAVGVAELSATGTASSSTYLRGDNAWATPTGGLTHASQWRLTTSFNGNATPIASNLEQVDVPPGYGVLGASMTQSSGIFTFPTTGYWWIRATHVMKGNTSLYENQIRISTTTNNSTYAIASRSIAETQATNSYQTASCDWVFDVTDTAQCKVRFDVQMSNASATTSGDTNMNETAFTFIRLGGT